jgi:hypothetical protein
VLRGEGLSSFEKSLGAKPHEQFVYFVFRLRVLDLELIDEVSHDTIGLEAFPEQFPYAGTRFIELEYSASRHINQYSGLVQALRDDFRIASQGHPAAPNKERTY